MKLTTLIEKTGKMLLPMALMLFTASSCDTIFDDEGDCDVHYRVKFRYDKNMKFADAFPNEVKAVHLYAFGPDGKLAWQGEAAGDALAQEGWTLPMDVEPGTYDLLAWAGLTDNGQSFTVPAATVGETTKEQLRCALTRRHTAGGQAESDLDLAPLFHAMETSVALSDRPGTHDVTMRLMKNTNRVRIVLQHISGEPVNPQDFTFTITSDNGLMEHDNSLTPDGTITYRPHHISSGTAELEEDLKRPADQPSLPASTVVRSGLNVAVAEFTIARLVMGNPTTLSVTNADGGEVLSIPLVDYALLVRGYENGRLDKQDYLDYQDEYNLTLFLDRNDNWVRSQIIINSWFLIHQDVTVGK